MEPAELPGSVPPRVGAATAAALAVTPLRAALAAAAVAAAARGVEARVAVAEAALGAGVVALALLFGPRVRPVEEALARAEELPPGARRAGPAELAVGALFPSTAGVAVLAAGALALDARLAALLGGILAGLGAASLAYGLRLWAWERRAGVRVLAERGGRRRLFLEPRA